MILNNHTFGIIGKNIKYSFSKSFFDKRFEKKSLRNFIYKIFDIKNIEFVKEILNDPLIMGCNVTIPYKISIIPFLDKITKNSKLIGSINVISIKNGYKIGYNTDFIGFYLSIKKYIKKNKHALILGTGGVSKSVSFVFKKCNIIYKYISRNKKGNNILNYNDLNEDIIKKYNIIVNCTPVGTHPNIDECPDIPYNYITKNHILYDLIYNPNKTLFLKKGEYYGAKIKNGLEMLYIQAEESCKIWNI